MSVTIVSKVCGSELLLALIRVYRQKPCSQGEAARLLDVPASLVSANTRVLIDAGVVFENPPRSGRRRGRCVVDEHRFRDLVAAMLAYTLDDD